MAKSPKPKKQQASGKRDALHARPTHGVGSPTGSKDWLATNEGLVVSKIPSPFSDEIKRAPFPLERMVIMVAKAKSAPLPCAKDAVV